MIIEKLNNFVESLAENKSPKAELRLSAAGSCPRQLDYDFQRGVPPVTFQHYFRMQLGSSFHEFMQGIISKALGDDYHSPEGEVLLQGYPGHCDGRIASLKATLEIKTVGEHIFNMIKSEGKPLDPHIDQGNAYAVAQGDEFVLILYVNRDSGLMEEFLFESSKDLADAVIGRFNLVKENQKKGFLTPRPYHDKTQAPCYYCGHKEICYEGFKEEVSVMKEALIVEPSLVSLARDSIKHRTTRLLSSKIEEALKDTLGKELFRRGINLAKMEDADGPMIVETKVGKNDNLLTNVRGK